MAEVKQAWGSWNSLSLTSANLATSATAGWYSAPADFTAINPLDIEFLVKLAAVNTAPANSKALFLFLSSLPDTSGADYVSTGDGTPGASGPATITFPDVTTNILPIPLVGSVPYPVQNKAINYSLLLSTTFRSMPQKAVLAMINHTGMTLNVSYIGWRGLYNTVT